MRICLVVTLTFLFAVSAATIVRAADITLDIARSGTNTAILDVDAMPNGPKYVLAVLPFGLNVQAVVTPDTNPKDLAFIVSREPQGVIAITGYTGAGRYTIRNAIKGIDADRYKIRLAKQSGTYESLVTVAAKAGPLIDHVDKAILDWTVQIDLPEGFEDLKPAGLAPVNNRLTLTPSDLSQGLIVDFKNPALGETMLSTTFGASITLFFALLLTFVASYSAWEKAPNALYYVFILAIVVATGFAIFRFSTHGGKEAITSIGGVAGIITLLFNLGLAVFAWYKKRHVVRISGRVVIGNDPALGVKISLVNSANQSVSEIISDIDGKYAISFWPSGSTKQGYVLLAASPSTEPFRREINLGPSSDEPIEIRLRLLDVVGDWSLDLGRTTEAISDNLLKCIGADLTDVTARKLASHLQDEFRYPAKISIGRDMRLSASDGRFGIWEVSDKASSLYRVKVDDTPNLGIMEKEGQHLVFRRNNGTDHEHLRVFYARATSSP